MKVLVGLAQKFKNIFSRKPSEKGKSKKKNLLEGLEKGERVAELRGITKKFPGGVVANDNINFEIKAGEVHSLLGENGAGKTTLMNILYGLYEPDGGEIFVRGEKVDIESPGVAHNFGIGMVHQHRKLVPAHTVIENIVLGHPKNERVIDMERAKREVRELAEKYGFDIDLDAKVWQLDAGEAQIVEILKVLYRGAELLIMDEPSSALTPREADELVNSLKTMTRQGLAVIPFITHKLPIALEISDRITVLRDGKVVDTVDADDINESELAEMMVGREVLFDLEKPEVEKGEEILNVQRISALNDQGAEAVKDATFSIREGEILGIAGVSGNGQAELVEALMGLREITDGKVSFEGEDITRKTVQERMEKGIGYVPSERETKGSVSGFSLVDNVLLNYYFEDEYSRFGLIDYGKCKVKSEKAVNEFNIVCPGIDIEVGHLSGGNLQKLILSRVILKNPKLLIANLPTHGLDVGAVEFVRNKLLEARKEGAGILLISKDLDEILALSDKIAPIYDGELQDIVSSGEATKEEIGLMMLGESEG